MQRNELEISMRSKDFLDQQVSSTSQWHEWNLILMECQKRYEILIVFICTRPHNIIWSYISSKVISEELISNALFMFYHYLNIRVINHCNQRWLSKYFQKLLLKICWDNAFFKRYQKHTMIFCTCRKSSRANIKFLCTWCNIWLCCVSIRCKKQTTKRG